MNNHPIEESKPSAGELYTGDEKVRDAKMPSIGWLWAEVAIWVLVILSNVISGNIAKATVSAVLAIGFVGFSVYEYKAGGESRRRALESCKGLVVLSGTFLISVPLVALAASIMQLQVAFMPVACVLAFGLIVTNLLWIYRSNRSRRMLVLVVGVCISLALTIGALPLIAMF